MYRFTVSVEPIFSFFAICNTSLDDEKEIEIELRDVSASKVIGEVMTADDIDAYNDFDAPDAVHPVALDAVIEGNTVKVKLPKMSVAVLTVE